MTKTNLENTESNHSFLRAARSGNLAKVIDFLETGTDINTCNDIGLTALHLSAKEGHIGVVEELIKRGPIIDATTKKGNTALHIASLAGKFDVVKVLVESSANVNYQSTNGFTPLYMASQENHLDVVTLLLNSGADQTITTEDGFTPLAVALQQGHERVVALLLENDNRSKQRMPALHIAVKKNDVNAVNLLLNSNDVDVNFQSSSGFTPLHIAAHYGNDRTANILIEHKADVNFQAKNNITPLHVAAKWGRSGMVQLLIDSGALVVCRTRDGLTPLHCSSRSGHAPLCEKLIDYGADVQAKTRNGLTPLHMAAQGDYDDTARLLIIKKANINETTTDFLTPLHVTAHYGNEKVARVLLDRRCDPNSRALNGFTPLHIACKKHKIKIVELLLKYGTLVEATTETGLTPLHVSAFIGSKEAVNMLLQKGANIEQATMRGETALHLATRNNQTETVKLLLRAGAVPDARARENQTPLHIATKIGNMELIALFLQSDANPNIATRDNYTALHIAAKEGRTEAITLLLDNGADIEALTKRNFTPLHIAAKYDKVAVTSNLLQQKANPNATGKNGLTPLHVATHYNHEKIAQLLLDNKADPKCKAKNGYSPLHIAAKMNNMDLASMLLVSDADSNAESRNGFSPLQLASQEGHTDMVSLLLLHKADVNHQAKNGLTSMHLAAQEDRVNVAKILVNAGANVTPITIAGYTPLHTAAHFGQINVAKYLIGSMNTKEINEKTELGFTGLHLAAQQGHLQLINLLLEHDIDPNIRNNQGWTAAHIARKQHYLNIFEVLRKVTTEVISWEVEEEETEEIVILEKPENMGEHAVSDSEDEGELPHRITKPDNDNKFDTGSLDRKSHLLSPKPDDFFRLSTSNDDIWRQLEYMKNDPGKAGDGTASSRSVDSRGDESFHESNNEVYDHKLTEIQPEKIDAVHIVCDEAYKTATSDWDFEPDNVPIIRKPISSGFLVSFMVDARGGCMQAQRFPNLRFYVPPSAALGPTRLVCRLIKPNKMPLPPSLNDGDGFACRLMEMGPCHLQFNSPILIEVPHYASLRGREREIIILRSDNGETWKEHPIEATDQAIQNSIGLTFNDLVSSEELKTNRIQRILTTDLPQYFAIITRIRQEVALIGTEGLVMSSSVVPQVQAVFPEGALLKKTRVGIQAHEISTEIVMKHCGNRVACSPIISIEPRRRKFHKPITLTVPLPKSPNKGMLNDPNNTSGASTLRLLCSITGGSAPAVWEDITGSTPLSFHKDCVSFTTTVSARLWLIDCPNVQGVAEMATSVYRDSIIVPYIGQFVVYGRRHDKEEAQFRILGITDDSSDKTLECQENFQLLASGPLVEILHKRPHWIETAGNLVPVTKTGEQLSIIVEVLNENRLSFLVRVKDPQQEATGKLAILLHQRNQGLSTGATLGTSSVLKPITTLEISFPTEIVTPTDTLRRNKLKLAAFVKPGIGIVKTVRSELDLRRVADQIGNDWRILARHLGIIDPDDLNAIENNSSNSDSAYAVLMLWKSRGGDEANGNELELVLRDIDRDDIVDSCLVNIPYDGSEVDEMKMIFKDLNKLDDVDDLLGNNKTPSVDESLMVETGDETASQRDNDIPESDEGDDNDDSFIVPMVDSKSNPIIHNNEITPEEKTKAYIELIGKLNDVLPALDLDVHNDSDYEDMDSIREDCIRIDHGEVNAVVDNDAPSMLETETEQHNNADYDDDSLIVPVLDPRSTPKTDVVEINPEDKTNAFVDLIDNLNDVLPATDLGDDDDSEYRDVESVREENIVVNNPASKADLGDKTEDENDQFIVPDIDPRSQPRTDNIVIDPGEKTDAFVGLISRLNDVLPPIELQCTQDNTEDQDLDTVKEEMIVIGDRDNTNDVKESNFANEDSDSSIVQVIDPRYNPRTDNVEISAEDKTNAFVDIIEKLNDVLPEVDLNVHDNSEYKGLESVKEDPIDSIKKPNGEKPELIEEQKACDIKIKQLRDSYAEFKPSEPLSPSLDPNKEGFCDFERNSEPEDNVLQETSTPSLCNYNISTTPEIDPDDPFSSTHYTNHMESSSRETEHCYNRSPPEIVCRTTLSEQSSIMNDSDQELMEDYSHQIDCLKEEMLTEFPSSLPGILPLFDTSRHNSCIAVCYVPSEDPGQMSEISNGSNDGVKETDIDQFVTDIINSVIKSAAIIIKSNSIVDTVIDNVEYSELICNTAKELVCSIINESMGKNVCGNMTNCGDESGVSPVLEPDSPLIEDRGYFDHYNDTSNKLKENQSTLEIIIHEDDSGTGMILPATGDECDLAPLSPIIECIEMERSPEVQSERKSECDNIDIADEDCDIKPENSDEYKEFEQIDGECTDAQFSCVMIPRSSITNIVNPLKETAIIDDVMDTSDTQSMNSNGSSQQYSVICNSRRAESLQQIDSESAAGLAIDLLCSDSRTTSMSSSIMQTSCHSTDSATLTTTTTASTLVRINQPYDDPASLSDNLSPGCMSSG